MEICVSNPRVEKQENPGLCIDDEELYDLDQLQNEDNVLFLSNMENTEPVNYEVLETYKKKIESMDKFSQLEVLKLLTSDKCKINENKSGVFVNLSFLDKHTINKLANYIRYQEEQEENFKTVEFQKMEYQTSLFPEK